MCVLAVACLCATPSQIRGEGSLGLTARRMIWCFGEWGICLWCSRARERVPMRGGGVDTYSAFVCLLCVCVCVGDEDDEDGDGDVDDSHSLWRGNSPLLS